MHFAERGVMLVCSGFITSYPNISSLSFSHSLHQQRRGNLLSTNLHHQPSYYFCSPKNSLNQNQQQQEDRPMFRRTSTTSEPRRTFLPTTKSSSQSTQTQDTILSPNDRYLSQIQKSLEALNAKRTFRDPSNSIPTTNTNQSSSNKQTKLQQVNVFYAVLGGIIASGLSWINWTILLYFYTYFSTHNFQDQMYFVQRLTAVSQIIIIGGFALASGFSAAISIGLLGLAGKIFIDRVTGALSNEKKDS